MLNEYNVWWCYYYYFLLGSWGVNTRRSKQSVLCHSPSWPRGWTDTEVQTQQATGCTEEGRDPGGEIGPACWRMCRMQMGRDGGEVPQQATQPGQSHRAARCCQAQFSGRWGWGVLALVRKTDCEYLQLSVITVLSAFSEKKLTSLVFLFCSSLSKVFRHRASDGACHWSYRTKSL